MNHTSDKKILIKPPSVHIIGITGIPEIVSGTNLGKTIVNASDQQGTPIQNNDVIVVTQKIVSKSEGKIVDVSTVEPSNNALQLAKQTGRDARLVELVLRESRSIVRVDHTRGILITETKHGFVCANAGVDLSNAPGTDTAVLLPEDPDASATRLRERLLARTPGRLGIVVSDTFGRPWRDGLVDVALGSAGFAPIEDARGSEDWTGRELQVTTMAAADQYAAAAGLLMAKGAGIPAVWISGQPPRGDGCVADLLRDPETDLFR